MLTGIVFNGQQPGLAAGRCLERPGTGGRPHQGTNTGRCLREHAHRVELQPALTAVGPAFQFRQQLSAAVSHGGSHHQAQSPESKWTLHLQPQQKVSGLGLTLQRVQGKSGHQESVG